MIRATGKHAVGMDETDVQQYFIPYEQYYNKQKKRQQKQKILVKKRVVSVSYFYFYIK